MFPRILFILMAVVMVFSIVVQKVEAGACTGDYGHYCWTDAFGVGHCSTDSDVTIDPSLWNVCCVLNEEDECGSKPDDSGCAADEYFGSCYKCNPCWGSECIEKCQVWEGTCCPCEDLDIGPDNLTVTTIGTNRIRLNWTPSDNTAAQYVQWTNNPLYYGLCNIAYSENPCEHSSELGASVTTYTLPLLESGTRYYIQVEGTGGLGVQYCNPPSTHLEYTYYPPSCSLTPESATVEVGTGRTFTQTSSGPVDGVWFTSLNPNYAQVLTSEDTTAETVGTNSLYRSGVRGLLVGNATIRAQSFINGVVVCTDTSTLTIDDVPVPETAEDGWWQTVGAGVYAGAGGGGVTIQSSLPTAASRLIIPGTDDLAAIVRASGTVNVGEGAISDENWSVVSPYQGKTMDYRYFASRMGVSVGSVPSWGGGVIDEGTIAGEEEDFYLARDGGDGEVSLAGPWAVTAGESYVVFVDGDLELNRNVTVAEGGFVAFIVNGGITVTPGVTQMQGVYVADELFTTETNAPSVDARLFVQGMVVAWGGVSLNRDLSDINNYLYPAEQFSYRSDLLINMPDKMKSFALRWQEVAPGSF